MQPGRLSRKFVNANHQVDNSGSVRQPKHPHRRADVQVPIRFTQTIGFDKHIRSESTESIVSRAKKAAGPLMLQPNPLVMDLLETSHETLAEMVGTTRARVTHFMNKFRTMGLIDYNGELTIRTELLTDLVLHD